MSLNEAFQGDLTLLIAHIVVIISTSMIGVILSGCTLLTLQLTNQAISLADIHTELFEVDTIDIVLNIRFVCCDLSNLFK